jgi:hypothetical protein
VSLLDQPPLQLAAARLRLHELKKGARQRLAAAVLLAAAGAFLLASGRSALGLPLLIGAAAAVLLSLVARDDRRRLLVRLVAQDDAWSIDEVRRTADVLISASQRRRLARGLVHAAQAGEPGPQDFAIVTPERAFLIRPKLQLLAQAIGDPGVPLRAPAAALCRRLLTDGFLSPLYNPHIPEGELERVIAVIERGVGR